MKGRAVIPLVLGLGIGIVAVKFVVDTLKKAKASGETSQKVTAVRAKMDIGAFAEIKPEMVELIETSETLLAPARDRVGKLEEAVGRVTSKAIPQFAPVLNSMLAAPGTSAGMEGRIKPGFRAVSVKIDEVTGVAYQIQPGDLVDVIVVMDIDTGDRRRTKETIAEVILQSIQVAAIGQSTASASTEEAGSSKVKPAKSATLLVTAEEATKLHLAATRGKITLSLRGKEDTELGNMPSANSNDLSPRLRNMNAAAVEVPPVQAVVTPTGVITQPAVAVAPEQLPHGVTVYRRSIVRDQAKVDCERITFENVWSSRILDVGDRPMSRSAAMMRPSMRQAEPAQQQSVVPQTDSESSPRSGDE